MPRRAFTLVELLVAIGVIAVLIGLLLPVVNLARAQAARTACLAQQREIGSAGRIYEQAHGGYLPLGGKVVIPVPTGIDNAGIANAVNDAQRRRYLYVFSDSTPWLQMPVPPELSLAAESSRLAVDDSNALLSAYASGARNFLRIFRCPSAELRDPAFSATSVEPVEAASGAAYTAYYAGAQLDYAFNGWLLGVDAASTPPAPLAGHASEVRRPASVVLLADALPRHGLLAWPARRDHAAPTLAEPFAEPTLADDRPRFDVRRHRGTINVLFVDGHAETLGLDAGALAQARLEH